MYRWSLSFVARKRPSNASKLSACSTNQFVVMIFTRRLPTIGFSWVAVVLVVQSTIDSLSHFEKVQVAPAPELKKVVCGRESNDMFNHLLWCSLMFLRAWMRHAFPIVPRFLPHSRSRKKITFLFVVSGIWMVNITVWASVYEREIGFGIFERTF